MYQIIANEADFLLVNKSPGVHFHSQDGQAGLVASIERDLDTKLYSVHRLDTMTSGLLLLAKTVEAAREFTQMFTEHKVQKYYLALAKGKPKKKQGWIVGDMAKSRRSMYKLLRTTENPAKTQFFSQSLDNGLRAYLLKPLSGKTHQLRVALASIGVPIFGDSLYGGAEASAERGYLHAYGLEFSYLSVEYHFLCPPEQGCAFTSSEMKNQLQVWLAPAKLDWPKVK